MGVGVRGYLPDQLPALGRGQPAAGCLGDHRPAVQCDLLLLPVVGHGSREGIRGGVSPVAIVWPCPLSVDAYVAAGRQVKFPRPDCPSCGGPLVFWSGYRRHVRAGGRCRKIFVPRLRCGPCRVTHALLFAAWAAQVANRRAHAETGQAPISRFEAGGPPRQADPGLLREAFRWSVTRKVTRTATVPLEGNAYAVDPALTGRRVELRYDPEDLTAIDVFGVSCLLSRHNRHEEAAGMDKARRDPSR